MVIFVSMDKSSKNILVTGGAGYIGSHTVVSLIEKGFNPIILDDFRNAQADVIERLEKIVGRKLKVIKKSCDDLSALNELFNQVSFWGVIHFAADKAVGESVKNPLKYFDNNIGGLITLLKAMQANAINRLVFSSSCTVYGDPENITVTEESAVSYASPYGFTKLMNEQMLTQFADANTNFEVVLLRYFNPIGAHKSALIGETPQGEPTNLLPYLTQTASGEREVLTVYGDDYETPDGTCIRDYIHVMDLADAHVAALNYLNKSTSDNLSIFNVGTGKGTSVKEMIDCFEQKCNVPLNWKVGPRRLGDIPAIYAKVDKANKQLKWNAKFSVDEAIADAWNYELERKKRMK